MVVKNDGCKFQTFVAMSWSGVETVVLGIPDEDPLMKADHIYEGFIRFEERSAQLYLELSVRFADNPPLRWFWVEMAMEEKQHAGMLQHCREAGVYAAALPDKKQVEKIEKVFRQIEERILAPDLALDEAFEAAARLESSEINDVYSRLTAPIEGPAHIMRKKMELSVAGHFEKLRNAARRFGASPGVQSRLSRLLPSGNSPHERA